MRFQNRRAYVTGGTGFIGGVLVRQLLAEGAAVTVVARDPARARHLAEAGATVEKGNVLEPATLHPEGHDLLVHGAAWVGYGIPPRKRELFRRTNVEGTRNVLDAARRGDVQKVVHVSSVAAAGRASAPDALVTEATPRPNEVLSLYEETKWEAHMAALESGLDVSLPMPGLVVGRGSGFDPLFKLFARGDLPVLPKGDAVKGWVHVADTVEGILLSALKGKGPYLLVDVNASVRELFEELAERNDVRLSGIRVSTKALQVGGNVVEFAFNLAGKTPPVSGELLSALDRPMRYDSSKVKNELGWAPRFWERMAEDVRAHRKA